MNLKGFSYKFDQPLTGRVVEPDGFIGDRDWWAIRADRHADLRTVLIEVRNDIDRALKKIDDDAARLNQLTHLWNAPERL